MKSLKLSYAHNVESQSDKYGKAENLMKKKPVIIAAIFVIGVVLFFLLLRKGGDISNVNRVIPQSEIYSKQDIAYTMDVVEDKFISDFKGCILTDLWYDEDISSSSSDEWADQYDADEAIVLLSNFNVDSSGGDGSLNPNSTYTDWQWILVRDKGSSTWKLETWGYG